MKGRKTGGRVKGVPNRKVAALAQAAIEEGITPLEVMLRTMRAAWEAGDKSMACSVAKDAAPYIHPKLISSDNTNETTVRYVAQMPAMARDSDEWAQQHSPTIQ